MTGPIVEFFPAPRIRRLLPVPPASTPPELGADWPVRSLHLNESPFAPAPEVVAAMQQAAAGLNRYPDHDGLQLVAALAARLGVASDRIVIGAGTNELLFASGEITLDPGDEAIAPDPGFVTYAKIVAMRDATFVGVPVRADGIVDVAATVAAVTPRTRLVYVATPNNPTGGMLEQAHVEKLVAELPDHVLLHYDEAYYEFGRHAGGPDGLALLERRKAPWIATRSFSKAYGLAGARIGYGIASTAAVAEAYRKIRINFSVNAVALAGALVALDQTAHTEALLEHTAQERDRLDAALTRLGFRTFPSAANFITAVAPSPARELTSALRELNVFVLPMPWRDSPGALRITIGTREDNDAVIAGLSRAMAAR
ncbi:MAG: aminotransferase class I/II-fold pyridoxal phosphate-dependent enzyme [Bradyrhizobium sp.]|nr:aminotransferase class I/II-fold pyridoxal phosphate-dependent enzyme [Bradyrhizobium sp.]